ncbi:MAG: hypothetical protein NTZ64_12540 [Polaromonas sp.]|nr:hypothetical protein [Polaromonas sp.]
MKHFALKPAWAFLFVAATLVGNADARLSSSTAGDPPAASKAKKHAAAKSSRVSQIRFLPGSGETEKERSSRLKRECKGRVNAGACAGYTY